MATRVYDVEEVLLQDDTKVTLRPLSITALREFMAIIAKTSDAQTEDETLTILIEACGVAIAKQLPAEAKLEDILDVPTINKILEVCGGIKMDDPNLLAAAVLAGQN